MRVRYHLIIVLLFSLNLYAQSPSDFDSDGISEILTVTSQGTSLSWSAIAIDSAASVYSKNFGDSNGLPVPGFLVAADQPSLCVATANGASLEWKTVAIDGRLNRAKLGRPGDLIVAGADFNGDGISDPATVRFKGDSIVWNIGFNLFDSALRKVRSIRFGTKGQKVFFMNYDGVLDSVASFGRSRNKRFSMIRLKNIATGETKTIPKLPIGLLNSGLRPFPLKSPEGPDVIGFVYPESGGDTGARFFSTDGKQISRVSVVDERSIVIGDFIADKLGEEVALIGASETSIYNPFDDSLTNGPTITGTAVGFTQFAFAEAPEPTEAPTAVPTATATVTPTPTPTPTATATKS